MWYFIKCFLEIQVDGSGLWLIENPNSVPLIQFALIHVNDCVTWCRKMANQEKNCVKQDCYLGKQWPSG